MKRSIFYWSAAVICLFLFNAPASLASTTENTVTQVATPVAVNNEVNSSQDFKVIDEFKDEADLGGGRKVLRIYSSPRQIFVDKGVKKIRPVGWNKFNEDSRSKIKTPRTSGYSFGMPVTENKKIDITSGSLERRNSGKQTSLTAPNKTPFRQFTDKDKNTISSFKNIYKDIDVNFIDKATSRTKEIVITKKPTDIGTNSELIFWEEYKIPTNAVVAGNDGEEISGIKDGVQGQISILMLTGEKFVISGAIIYDGSFKDINDIELRAGTVKEIVEVNRTNNKVRIGLKVPAEYLLSTDRIYPVTIDPTYSTYYACKQGSSSNIGSCNINEVYLRYMTSNSILAGQSSAYLVLGYWNDATGPASRQPVIAFMQNDNNYFQNLTSYGTFTSAKLYLTRSENAGLGSTTGSDIPTHVMKITKSWSKGTVIYGHPGTQDDGIHNYLSDIPNSDTSIPRGIASGASVFWDVSSAVQYWINGGLNYGLYVEPTPHWASGSTPNWPLKNFWFRSSVWGNSGGPYLELNFITPKPDLIINSKSLSKTTISPGETISVTDVTVKNSGTATAAASQVGYYYSENSICTLSDTLLGYDIVEILTAGVISTEDSESITIPASATVGATRYICFIADRGDVVVESEEKNNTASVAFTVAAPAAPDLTFSGTPTVNPTSPVIGGQTDINAIVQNNGNATSNNTVIKYYIDGTPFGEQSVQSLSAGDWIAVKKTVAIPKNTSLNSHDIQLSITAVTGETVTNNNTTHIYPNFVSGFDFSPQNFSISDTSVHYSGNDDTVSISGQVKNTGSISASNIGYQLNLVKGAQKYALSNLSPSSLSINAGATNNVTLTGVIPNGMPYYDNYQIEVILDTNLAFTESNENNNTALTSNTVPVQQYYYGGGEDAIINTDGDSQNDVEEAQDGANIQIPNAPPAVTSPAEDAKPGDGSGGDPVNLRTGSFELTQTDLTLQGIGEGIAFVREYNSKTSKNARFGMGWRYSYNQYYFFDPDTSKVVVYKGGTEASVFELKDVDGVNKYVSMGEADQLYYNAEHTYLILEKLNGIKYYYSIKLTDNMGLLEKIVDTNGNETNFSYEKIRGVDMLKIVSDSGRSVTINYGVAESTMWDKIIKITYATGDSNTETVVNYTYDEVESVVRLRQVDRVRKYNGQTETQIDKFGYAKFGASTEYRIATHEDPRGTILYNIYDSTGRVTEQSEYNPLIDAVGTKRKVWTFEYLEEDPAVTGDAYCSLIKNYSDTINYYSQKYCYNSSNLKVYESGNNGDTQIVARNADGMVTSITDSLNKTTSYGYDIQRRKIKEILPDTNLWHTEISYIYGAFNRIQTQTTKVWSVGANYDVAAPVSTKIISQSIDAVNGNILSITDSQGEIKSFTYDSHGNVLTHTDKKGHVTTFTYSANGNYLLTESQSVTLPDNTTQTITKQYGYDDYGRRISYTTPSGKIFKYEYDNRGNLRKEIDPDLNFKTYQYDIEGHKTDMYDELNRHTQFVYGKDIGASLISEKKYSLDNNHIITINTSYDNLGRSVLNYDAKGNTIQTVYDSYGRSFKRIDISKTTEYSYYANGDIRFEYEYANGYSSANWLKKTEYLYDSRNNLLETRQYRTDSNYISTFNEYDGFDRVIRTIDANGNTVRKFYDGNDRLVTEVDAVGNTTTYSYDKNSNKIGVMQPRCLVDVNYCNSDGYSVSYVYDEANRLIKQKNADNKVTLYFYNQDSQVTKIVDRQNVDGSGNTRVKQFEYDALGRKIMEKDADNATIVYSYDKVGNLKTMTDQKGRVITFVYDDFNRLVQEKDPGQNITAYTYDDNGNKTSVTDPGAVVVTTNYEYDSSNRLHKVVDANGDYREFTYDIFGNKTKERNKNGLNTNFEYDKLGRLTSETNTLGASTAYTYDNNGNQLSVTVGGNKITSYLYDELNQIKQITYPSDKIEKWTYDANGNKSAYTDGNNQVISFDYDKLDRLTAKHLPGNIFTVEYIYDNWNNLTHLSDESGTTDYVYDNLNRVTNESKLLMGLDINKTIGRVYDSDGQIKIITDAVGRVFNYDYNNRAFLDKVTYLGQTLASYTYTAYGKVDKIVFANGVTTNYLYDVLNRTTEIKTWNASGTLFLQNFQYDAESNRVTLIENGVRTTTYDYDSLDQLTGVDYKDVNGVGNDLSYTYDPSGNRTALVSPTAAVSYTFNPNTNELATVSYSNGRLVIASEYDGNGSVTKETYTRLGLAIKEITNTWDTQNRLTGVTYHALNVPDFMPILPDNTMSFVYDDFGNRAMKQSNNEKVYYLNDGLTVFNELSIFGGVTKTLVNNVAEIDKNDIITYIHQDILGSTVLLTNAQGQKVGEYEYEPFGTLIGYDGTQETDYLYTGQELDTESELYYYNARYYNPVLGRFISRDPVSGRVGNSVSRNGYVYVLNNPLKYVDPSGEIEEDSSYLLFADEHSNSGMHIAGFTNVVETFSTTFLDLGTMLMPVANDLRDLYEIRYKKDMISGRRLSDGEVTLTEAGATVVILSGRELRLIKNTTQVADNAGRASLRAIRRMRGQGAYRMVSGMAQDLEGDFYNLQKMSEGKIRFIKNGQRMTPSRELDFILQDGQIKFGDGHSFLSKGKNVDYAGKIKFNKDITDVDSWTNWSGHYQPSALDGKGIEMIKNAFSNRFGISLKNFTPYQF